MHPIPVYLYSYTLNISYVWTEQSTVDDIVTRGNIKILCDVISESQMLIGPITNICMYIYTYLGRYVGILPI